MIERKLVPHIRFKGLEEEWETKKLEEFSKIVGGGTPDTNKTDYWNGSINWYSPTEIGKKPYVYSSNKKITELGLKKSSAKIHPANTTILFTSRAGIGDMAILKKPAATNQGFQSIELNDNVSPYFIYSYGFMIKNKAERLASGSTFLEISKRDMKRIALKLPTLKEQQKIGDLFAKLDRLLDLQQQKLDQLELLKKALLQKLFPKQGTEIPELRFKGFEDEWKQEQFSYLYKKRSEKNDLTFGPDRIISVANMYFKQTETRSDEKYMKTYNVFRLGDIAFEGNKSKRFSFGRFVENTVGDGIVSHVFEVFRPITSYDLNYWKYAIHNENFMGPILRRSTIKATMMNNLIEKDFLKQKVSVPKLSEQQKIGNLLAKVDRLIELENKKFSNLKLVKKSLLQNMFVE